MCFENKFSEYYFFEYFPSVRLERADCFSPHQHGALVFSVYSVFIGYLSLKLFHP